jgi:hypothetical protein
MQPGVHSAAQLGWIPADIRSEAKFAALSFIHFRCVLGWCVLLGAGQLWWWISTCCKQQGLFGLCACVCCCGPLFWHGRQTRPGVF